MSSSEPLYPVFDTADRLRKAREAAGLDQVDLAERMGVSRGTISNNELGKVGPRTSPTYS